MDIYIDSKSRWRPNSKSRHGGNSRKCTRKCSICHPTRLAANKTLVAKELEAESRKRVGPVGRPATEYVDWFFSREEEAEDEAESEWGDGDWSAEEVGMVMGMGREEYERMVREHVEAERQLERETKTVGTGEEERVSGEGIAEMVGVEEEHGERDWDVVSTGSVDSIRLEDWEEVIVE
jgi:hypothetical protein